MAVRALTTGAPTRAPFLETVLTQFGAVGGSPTTPLSLSRANRAWIGDMIETLIAVLDFADADVEAEDGDLDSCLAADDGCGAIVAAELENGWRNAA